MVNLMFGVWLEDCSTCRSPWRGSADGLSELGGEGLVALFVDRIGKVRAAGLGIIVNSIAAILLPIIGRTEFGALVGLFFFFISQEFTIVSIIPLNSEVMPSGGNLTAGSATLSARHRSDARTELVRHWLRRRHRDSGGIQFSGIGRCVVCFKTP
jgi:hypothetical protein